MSPNVIRRIAMAVLTWTLVAPPVMANDWPMWRFDPARTASSQQHLADGLHLQWALRLPPLEVAWPDQDMMWFDRQYEPIVVGRRMFVASSRTDSLTAYDTRTGKALWEFRADGPLRFAPAAWQEKLFVAGDDGHLYCLAQADGRVIWKHRGGPSNRKLLGNERLISMWPARGGPVVADDTVYYAAGIWPFLGIFLHALDAETGTVVWTNDGEGSRFTLQPHNTPSFAGVAPQGSLVVEGERLIVPGGRSVPACYDRRTGRLLHYELAANNKRGGGSAVASGPQLIFNGTYSFGSEQGESLDGLRFSTLPVVHGRRVFYGMNDQLQAVDLDQELFQYVDSKDRKGQPIKVRKLNLTSAWTTSLDVSADLIRAGDKLFGGAGNRVYALRHAATPAEKSARTSWETTIDGTVARLLAADDRLFVVTLEGTIYCFGADAASDIVHRAMPRTSPVSPAALQRAKEILQSTQASSGYTVVWGVGDGSLVQALVQASDLHIIAVEPDAARARDLRTELVQAGVYGRRAMVLVGSPATLELPPYFASSMICEDPLAAGLKLDAPTIARLYDSLRPYGGKALFRIDTAQRGAFVASARAADLPRLAIREVGGDGVTLVREGALVDSADWTHEHADASNTRTSRDKLVKLPLGVLWFGGPSHNAILPRHGHGPQPQVVDGRVIIEGPDIIRATDVYTGRLFWERELPGVGALYDNTAHHAGANGTGANFISLPDGIYTIYAPGCVRLDPRDGRTMKEFALPTLPGADAPPSWNFINVVDNYLVAGIDLPESMADPRKRAYEDVVASKRIYVLDRHTGRIHWSFDAEFQFRNNAICFGGGRLYCVDLLSNAELDLLKRRGQTPQHKSKLYALDLATGSILWSTDREVFGTWLSYSNEHDVLVESGRPGRDVLNDEPKGMRAFRAANGEVLWQAGHSGPAILHGERILGDRQACELLTGRILQREDPLTGRQVDWTWKRNYGCNTPQASEHLLLFRSGAAGYYDLTNDGGTGNFGGFRSSCTNNLIAAGGVLSVPEYTRTCNCDYQNQTSLALVHMPDVELWTEFPLSDQDEVRNLALNLGAPGFRRAPDGRLWINAYSGAKLEFEGEGYYCRHSSNVVGDAELPWVGASRCRGIRRLALDPHRKQPGTYTVRLHFCDPDNDRAGARVFDVQLQGRTVLENFDPVSDAGGRLRSTVKEFRNVRLEAQAPLIVEFVPSSTSGIAAASAPILNGIELILE